MMNIRLHSYLAMPFAALVLVAVSAGNAHSEEYTCPYLKDKQRQMLYEMSQGKDGWFFRDNTDFKEDFSLSNEAAHNLSRMAEAFKQRGTTMVMIPLPVRGMVAHDFLSEEDDLQKSFDSKKALDAYSSYINDLKKTGMQVVNLAENKDIWQPEYFFERDIHWTPEGSRLTAEQVGKLVKSLPEYKKLTPAAYETKRVGDTEMKGKVLVELMRLCTSKVPAEKIPVYETRLKATGADALFGSSDDPSALIGTSFSDIDFLNFEGFLSQNTGLAIANYSIGAGELFVAMVSYTSSPKFATTHPPFLFWETPGHYNINVDSEKFFRQIIPAVKGECSEKEAVASGEFEVVDGKGGELLQIPEDLNATGSDYYLFINSSNIEFVKFSLEMEYNDGDGEWFTVDHSERFKNSGRYFVELWDDIPSALTSVKLKDSDKINAKLDVRLCKTQHPAKS